MKKRGDHIGKTAKTTAAYIIDGDRVVIQVFEEQGHLLENAARALRKPWSFP
jgi:hypothetical protein